MADSWCESEVTCIEPCKTDVVGRYVVHHEAQLLALSNDVVSKNNIILFVANRALKNDVLAVSFANVSEGYSLLAVVFDVNCDVELTFLHKKWRVANMQVLLLIGLKGEFMIYVVNVNWFDRVFTLV